MSPAIERDVAAPDGTRLVQRTWTPDAAVSDAGVSDAGSLLLVHGLGEHARRYEHVADALTAIGVEVWSWDHRGFGRSAGARGTLPHANALVDDVAFMFDRLAADRRARGDARPPFVLGHSMGGCVVARAVTGGWVRPRGMVLSSPALVPRLSAAERWAAALGSRLLPNLRVSSGVRRDRLSHDPAVAVAMNADAECHDRVTPRLVESMRVAGLAAIADAPRCTVPTLLLVAGDDRLVDPAGARVFHARLPAGVGTLRVYDDLYHEIFNERAPDRAAVLRDLAAWLRARD